MERHSFRAMGTTVELVVEADYVSAELAAGEAEFERLEQVMSRFRPDSELSQLNRQGWIEASPDLVEVVELAVDARERTGGAFDPTVHHAVEKAGYDRTFTELPEDAPDDDGDGGSAACGGRIVVEGRRIELEDGFAIDLGGIGKGFAAERVAERLALAGPCLVDAGGDIAVRGVPEAGAWSVAVDDELTLGIVAGGVATSGRDRRIWRRGGKERHHLIDPATGRPSETDLLRVTVVAQDAVEAEVLAKALFLGGSSAASAADVPAVLVTEDGRRLVTGGL
jgi:thiamine biosynthesis lipoprotein